MKEAINNDIEEMRKFSDEFFSIVPGIENASDLPILFAKNLQEDVFKKDWVDKNKACLIKGAIEHWPAIEKWRDKNFWLSMCEDFEVTVYPHMNFNNFKRANKQVTTFHAAVERLFQNIDHTFSFPGGQIRDKKKFEKIFNDHDLPGFSFLPKGNTPRIYPVKRFFMYRRASSAWHVHSIDETLMCQVNGAKRVALLPPTIPNTKLVSQFLAEEQHLEGKSLDKSMSIPTMIANVEEGDALYIPPYWHHAVVPNDGEIGFTLAYCWKSPVHILGDSSNYFVQDFYKQRIWPSDIVRRRLFYGYAKMLHRLKSKTY